MDAKFANQRNVKSEETPGEPGAEILVNFEKLECEDIGLRFQLNEETRQVIVYVINRATQKVIRAIPQEKLINLQASDMLDLLAQ